MTYSLVTAIIPTLMPFLVKMNTGLGAFSRDDFIKQTTHQESGGSFVMQSLRSPQQSGSKVSRKETLLYRRCFITDRRLKMRADNVNFQSMVVSQRDPRRSISSDDSQRVMVRKSVDVSYSNENGLSGVR
jgi:hypothetical protein